MSAPPPSQQGQSKTAVTQDLEDHMTSLRAAMRWKQADADLPAQQAAATAMIELEIHATHSVAAGSALRSGARDAPVPGVVSAAAHDWYNSASTGTHNPAAWAKVRAADEVICEDLRLAFIAADTGDGKVAAMANRVTGMLQRDDVPQLTCDVPDFTDSMDGHPSSSVDLRH